MAKKTKKNIKLRKRIRRTLGAICLITAMLVAMIPVPDAVAAIGAGSDGSLLTWDSEIWKGSEAASLSNIPVVPKNCETIYTTGDGLYQFAFVNESRNSSNKIAVILGYSGGTLTNNELTIPDSVDAYTKYNLNDSTYGGYVAVSKSQKPLFYEVEVIVNTPSGNDMIPSTTIEYRPCYYVDKSKWDTNTLENFYFYDRNTDSYIQTTSQDEQWIRQIEVAYIGNQSLISNDSTASGGYVGWVINEASGTLNTVPERGIFANKGNIVNLKIGDKLRGIGNYAFYGCTGIRSIKLGNGLIEIGKSAFESCNNMTQVEMNVNSNITYISDNAFKNCKKLDSFKVPVNVKAIYDSAFEGCSALTALDLAGTTTGQVAALQKIGYYVFKGCTALQTIEIPESLTGDSQPDSDVVWLNNFIGCSDLRSIIVQSSLTKFKPTTNFPVEETGGVMGFKENVHPSFFFSCKDVSETHTFTKANAIAFKYAGEDKYEIILREEAIGGGDKANIIYQVNSRDELLYFNMDKEVEEIEIPVMIGPHNVSAINAQCFSGNCYLRKITIPASVTAINVNAFKGCHNLRHVIFRDAATLTKIEDDAFATQVSDLHNSNCQEKDTYLSGTPELTFTGKVGSSIVPFKYAMNADSNINAGAQPITYIKYYSGWPTNLEVQYNRSNNKAELLDYPTRAQLAGGKYNKTDYPYMTDDLMTAATGALEKYDRWIVDGNVQITANEWDIINSVLKVSIPEGVTGIKTGLFSGVKGVKQDGAYTGATEPVRDGANSGVSGNGGGSYRQPDTTIESVTLASIEEFEPFTFSGCVALDTITITGGAQKIDDYAFAYDGALVNADDGLRTFNMTGGGESIGKYAFQGNTHLSDVTISSTVTALGLRPFKKCPAVKAVSFSGGPYFTTDRSIIYGLKDGKKNSVVQCLEARGNTSGSATIEAVELSGVAEIMQEAFMDCEKLGSVDLTSSVIKNVPVNAFAGTKGMYSVSLPRTCTSISRLAFHDSGISYLAVPSSVTFLDPLAFNTEANHNSEGTYKTITFYCEPGSAAETYANEYESIIITDKPIEKYFTVIFWGKDRNILDTQEVMMGDDAVPPEPPVIDGFEFDTWLPDYKNISRDMDIVAQYNKIDSEEKKYTVTFIDHDDKVLPYTQKVAHGENAIVPQSPTRSGYKFTGWRPAITNITADTKTYAQYEKITPSGGGDGSGGGGGNGTPSGGDTNKPDPTPPKLYTLTVMNGNGSGSYVAGATIIVVANEPASTQQFSKWTTDNKDIKFASDKVAATTMVMPAVNATVTANYEKKSGTTNGGGTNGPNNNGNTVTKNDTTNKGGTTVVIDKNGLSNTGVVSATVNGSSDNFVIKITEDADATEAAVKALMEEYGSLDNLKYFPMDISLYDSKGEKKITDTTGLSITITLPIPDSLIPYAGNNKIAGVVNDMLDKLGAKFTTINKVSCITFTAEHFSPYVIYVNTQNLSASGTADDSPKTGDIHPKWFFVIGLCCMSVILFAKRDKVRRAAHA